MGIAQFSFSQGFETTNHLPQQKAFFQFSYQVKARVRLDRGFVWLGHIPCMKIEGQSCRTGRGWDCGPKVELTKKESVWFSHTRPHLLVPVSKIVFHLIIIEMLRVNRWKLTSLSKTK